MRFFLWFSFQCHQHTAKHSNRGHLRVFKNLSVIERRQLLGCNLKKIVLFGTKCFVRWFSFTKGREETSPTRNTMVNVLSTQALDPKFKKLQSYVQVMGYPGWKRTSSAGCFQHQQYSRHASTTHLESASCVAAT